jgi:5-methylcytosine-specific restriction endonuclease McrA
MNREGSVARCKREVHKSRAIEGPDNHHPCILDHIRPIARGGDQGARENLQVLCGRCNRIKTARDMGKIAWWKKYHGRGLALQEGDFLQGVLF